MSDLIGTAIKLSESESPVVKDERYRIRTALDLVFKKLLNRFILRVLALGLVPLDRYLNLFGVGEKRQRTDSLLGVGGNSLEEILKMSEHPLDRASVE